MLKYGREAFAIEQLGEYATQAETDAAETRFIIELGTLAPAGYNLRHGGLNGGHSEESIAKLRGIKRSEATRAKLRAIVKTPEWRANLAKAHRGKPATHAQMRCLAMGQSAPKDKAGVKNGRAKLTDDDVRAIRRMYAAGGVSLLALADEFGVDQTAVGFIVRRVRWTHVTD